MQTPPPLLSLLAAVLALAGQAAAPARAEDSDRQAQLAQAIARAQLKQKSLRPAAGILRFPYLLPLSHYTHLFDWDMYFEGVDLSYDGVGQPVADSVKCFLDLVGDHAAQVGYVPRELAPDYPWALPEMCKPFLAQAALRASLTLGDFAWLKAASTSEAPDKPVSFYQKLRDTVTFWERNRQQTNGLFVWYNGVESGVDNNLGVVDVPANVIEGVDLQCYLYREYLALSVLAGALGRDDDAGVYQRRALTLREEVQRLMWNSQDEMYENLDVRTGEFVRVKTWTNFVPLWTRFASPDQARRTVTRHLLNPKEFWSPHGVRTLSRDNPIYDPTGYWRGPVWVVSNYVVAHGLENYGYHAEALELANKTVELLLTDFEKSGGMNENYHPETGVPAAGGDFGSWDLLGEHIVDEIRNGVDASSEGLDAGGLR